MLRKIAATKFKDQCLALLETLPKDGIVVTKHGRMIARVLPYREGNAELIGSLAEKIVIEGDLETTGVAWAADGRPCAHILVSVLAADLTGVARVKLHSIDRSPEWTRWRENSSTAPPFSATRQTPPRCAHRQQTKSHTAIRRYLRETRACFLRQRPNYSDCHADLELAQYQVARQLKWRDSQINAPQK